MESCGLISSLKQLFGRNCWHELWHSHVLRQAQWFTRLYNKEIEIRLQLCDFFWSASPRKSTQVSSLIAWKWHRIKKLNEWLLVWYPCTGCLAPAHGSQYAANGTANNKCRLMGCCYTASQFFGMGLNIHVGNSSVHLSVLLDLFVYLCCFDCACERAWLKNITPGRNPKQYGGMGR